MPKTQTVKVKGHYRKINGKRKRIKGFTYKKATKKKMAKKK
jgi:hypothetical protein